MMVGAQQNMAATMNIASFASRRPAADGLPQFQLPAVPTVPEIPRVTADALSPMSSSTAGGSQSSGGTASMSNYYGQQAHGSWPTPGSSNSSYTYAPGNQVNQPMSQSAYVSRGVYGQPPSMPYTSRGSHSPATSGGEGLPPPQYDHHSHHAYPAPMSGGGGSASGPGAAAAGPTQASLPSQGQLPQSQNAMMNSQSPAQTQPQQAPPVSAPQHVDTYPQTVSRPPPGAYYTPASTPQQSNFPSFAPQHSPHPSPTTSGGPQRPPVTAIVQPAGPTGMAPPQPYRPPYAAQYPAMQQQMSGPIMSNMGNPGGQMSLVPGMGVQPSYGQIAHGLYGHGPQQAPQDRPFKCDQCTQSFNRNHDLKRHRRIHLAVKPFPCTFCDKSFSRKDALKRHRLVKGCDSESNKPNTSRDGKDNSDSGHTDRSANLTTDGAKKE